MIRPSRVSVAALLQKSTPMPVTQVSGPVTIEANCVYVIPPGKHLAKGRVRLPEENRPSITGGQERDDEKALRETLNLLRTRTGHDFSGLTPVKLLRLYSPEAGTIEV